MACRTPFRSAVLALTLLAVPAQAQESAADPRHSLRAGAWALEFGVQPVFTSGFFGSAALSLKHQLSDRLGLRVGAQVGLSERQSDRTGYEVSPGVQVDYEETLDSDSRDYTAFLHLQPFLSVRDRTAIYLYGGPLVRWVTSTVDERTLVSSGAVVDYTRNSDAWYAGLELGAGFEWFWSQRLSLGAYYGVAGTYGEFDREERFHSTEYAPPGEFAYTESGKTFDFNTRGSFFRLAAYF